MTSVRLLAAAARFDEPMLSNWVPDLRILSTLTTLPPTLPYLDLSNNPLSFKPDHFHFPLPLLQLLWRHLKTTPQYRATGSGY